MIHQHFVGAYESPSPRSSNKHRISRAPSAASKTPLSGSHVSLPHFPLVSSRHLSKHCIYRSSHLSNKPTFTWMASIWIYYCVVFALPCLAQFSISQLQHDFETPARFAIFQSFWFWGCKTPAERESQNHEFLGESATNPSVLSSGLLKRPHRREILIFHRTHDEEQQGVSWIGKKKEA